MHTFPFQNQYSANFTKFQVCNFVFLTQFLVVVFFLFWKLAPPVSHPKGSGLSISDMPKRNLNTFYFIMLINYLFSK